MKPTILLLGTVHLGNPDNDDAFKMEVEGLQTEKRQQELSEVITCLETFLPTKIGVEVLKERESELNSELEQYLQGTFNLTNYEQHQIGFRLAERLNLTEIHAVDWNETRGDGENPWVWAEKYQPELFQDLQEFGQKLMGTSNEKYRASTIKEFLLWLNSPAYMKMDQEMYMKMALFGDEQTPAGIQWLSDYWAYRNLMIYKNVVELVASPDERILLIYGAGHLNPLHRALQDSGLFNVEPVEKYLS
jgi:hypothetical protein